jgi:tight adherence protein C
MTPVFIALAAGACVTLVVWAVWELNREVVSSGEQVFGIETEVETPLIRLLLPYARSAGVILRRILPEAVPQRGVQLPLGAQLRGFLARQLLYAGSPAGLLPEEFAGLMVVSGLLGAGLWAVAALLLTLPSWWLPATFAAGLLGFALPAVWLRDTVAARRKGIRKALPYAMDLLTLSVEAGLDFTVAMSRLVQKLGHSALGHELSKTLKGIQMGATRKTALRGLSERIGMLEVSFLSAALIQADELGASLGPILRIQGDQLRQRRFMAAEEMAMKAPVKMIFPLAIFVLPITMIVILGPVLIKFLPQMQGVVAQDRQVKESRP